jgi:hypothetical protein
VDISSGYPGRCAQQISTPLNAAHGFFFRESLFAYAEQGEQVREEDSDRRIYAAHAA